MTFLTEPQRRTVFDKVLTLVDTKFSGADVDVGQLRDVHGPRVVGSRTLEDFEQALDGLLRDLKTSHTGFFHEARPRPAGRIAMAATLTKANTAKTVSAGCFRTFIPAVWRPRPASSLVTSFLQSTIRSSSRRRPHPSAWASRTRSRCASLMAPRCGQLWRFLDPERSSGRSSYPIRW